MNLLLRNSHSILAALNRRPRDVVSIQLPELAAKERASPEVEMLRELAKKNRIPLRTQKPQQPSRKFSADERETFFSAEVREKSEVPLKELFGENPSQGLWLALDCIQDPRNVGAIFRSAAFFGVRGILLTEDRSASLTAIAYDVACGGVECVPFSFAPNLARALQQAKDQGVWTLGSSEHSVLQGKKELKPENYIAIKKDRAWLLILGNEERGMRRLTTENCDALCKIPSLGPVSSLNVSVAAGVLMAHLCSP